jgi:hypothetical protein
MASPLFRERLSSAHPGFSLSELAPGAADGALFLNASLLTWRDVPPLAPDLAQDAIIHD